jgi:coenzyme F420-0:L-glutamate ligase / coenzyme F420-1:gamma-L-glutamate ligase
MTPIGYDDLLELLRSRRSVRRFLDTPVGRADIARLLEAARWAPSNHNRQPWKFLVIEDQPVIRGLAERVGQSLAMRLQSLPPVASVYASELAGHATVFGNAPLLIVALHKHSVRLSAAVLEGVSSPALVSGEPLSVAMAVQNLLLAAQALKLGACVLTAPLIAQDVVAAALDLSAGFDVTCFVAVGYPAEVPVPPRRKSLEQIGEFRHDPPASGSHADR